MVCVQISPSRNLVSLNYSIEFMLHKLNVVVTSSYYSYYSTAVGVERSNDVLGRGAAIKLG